MEVLQQEIDRARADVAAQRISPVYYFMLLNRMDVGVLSGYTGIWQWRIKRHFKSAVFQRLSDRLLQKYADAFDITVLELKNFKGD